MKFGKTLKQEKEYMNAWAEHFMSYKELKKMIKPIAHHDDSDDEKFEPLGRDRKSSISGMKPTFLTTLEEDKRRVEKFYKHLLNLLSTQLGEIQLDIEAGAHLERREKKKHLKSHRIDRKLREKYELLTLLAHYCEINREGFRKIVKKWDKNTEDTIQNEFMVGINELSFSDHSELKDKIRECERMYADAFMNGNIEEASKKLQYLKVQVRLASGQQKDGVTGLVSLLVHLFKESRKKKQESQNSLLSSPSTDAGKS